MSRAWKVVVWVGLTLGIPGEAEPPASPARRATLDQLIEVYRAMGEWDREREAWKELLIVAPERTVRLAFAERLAGRNLKEEARDLYRHQWELEPGDREAARRTVEFVLELDPEIAGGTMEVFLARWPEDVEVRLAFVQWLRGHGEPERSRLEAEAALARLDRAAAPRMAARLLALLDCHEESRAIWMSLLTDHPDDREVLSAVAQGELDLKAWEAAKRYIERLAGIAPEAPDTLLFKAHLAFGEGRFGEAADTLAYVRAHAPPGWRVDPLFYAEMLMASGRWPEGLRVFREELRGALPAGAHWRRQDLLESFAPRGSTDAIWIIGPQSKRVARTWASGRLDVWDGLRLEVGGGQAAYDQEGSLVVHPVRSDVPWAWVRADLGPFAETLWYVHMQYARLSGGWRTGVSAGGRGTVGLLSWAMEVGHGGPVDDPVDLVPVGGWEQFASAELRVARLAPVTVLVGARAWALYADPAHAISLSGPSLGEGRRAWVGVEWVASDLAIDRFPYLSFSYRHTRAAFEERQAGVLAAFPLLVRQDEHAATVYALFRWQERWEVEGSLTGGVEVARQVLFGSGSLRLIRHEPIGRVEIGVLQSYEATLIPGASIRLSAAIAWLL